MRFGFSFLGAPLSSAGFAKPKYSASFGHTLTQSRHFMQPGSTTMPYSRTSSCTRTFEVHTAVQWPQPSQASVTRMRAGAKRSSGRKNPPYGHPYVQNPFAPRKYTIANPQMNKNSGTTNHALYPPGNVCQKSLVVNRTSGSNGGICARGNPKPRN